MLISRERKAQEEREIEEFKGIMLAQLREKARVHREQQEKEFEELMAQIGSS